MPAAVRSLDAATSPLNLPFSSLPPTLYMRGTIPRPFQPCAPTRAINGALPMAWYVDGRGRRGHVSTRVYRAPRDLEPLRFRPGDLGHDARFRTWEASAANAIAELRLEREGKAYPRYPGEAKRWTAAAVAALRWAGDERSDIAIAADVLAQSAPRDQQ